VAWGRTTYQATHTQTFNTLIVICIHYPHPHPTPPPASYPQCDGTGSVTGAVMAACLCWLPSAPPMLGLDPPGFGLPPPPPPPPPCYKSCLKCMCFVLSPLMLCCNLSSFLAISLPLYLYSNNDNKLNSIQSYNIVYYKMFTKIK